MSSPHFGVDFFSDHSGHSWCTGSLNWSLRRSIIKPHILTGSGQDLIQKGSRLPNLQSRLFVWGYGDRGGRCGATGTGEIFIPVAGWPPEVRGWSFSPHFRGIRAEKWAKFYWFLVIRLVEKIRVIFGTLKTTDCQFRDAANCSGRWCRRSQAGCNHKCRGVRFVFLSKRWVWWRNADTVPDLFVNFKNSRNCWF